MDILIQIDVVAMQWAILGMIALALVICLYSWIVTRS